LEFAAGGFNILLVSRNEKALAAVAAECSSKYHVSTEVVPADLSDPDSVDHLIAAILAKPVRYEVLVNNAGFGIHGDFVATDIKPELNLLHVQLTASLKLTKAVLPAMVSNRKGRILNVASVYGYSPVPYQSVYSACKAFLLSFSNSLRNELEETGVSVTVFCPGITQSEFRKRAGISEKRGSGMSAEAAARIAYTGTVSGKSVVVPGFSNRLFVFASRVVPGAFFAKVVKRINRIRGVSR